MNLRYVVKNKDDKELEDFISIKSITPLEVMTGRYVEVYDMVTDDFVGTLRDKNDLEWFVKYGVKSFDEDFVMAEERKIWAREGTMGKMKEISMDYEEAIAQDRAEQDGLINNLLGAGFAPVQMDSPEDVDDFFIKQLTRKDHINPKHYKNHVGDLQWIEVQCYKSKDLAAALEMQIDKYLSRSGKDDRVQELRKAKFYLDFLIAWKVNGEKPLKVAEVQNILNRL